MSTLELFDLVALQRDVAGKNLRVGDVGAVVEVLNGPAVVVEFLEASGDTRAVMTIEEADLQRVEPNEMLTVRSAIRDS